MPNKIITIKTERGWVGHFICGDSCRFRRNTLLSRGNKRMVVSTVGNFHINGAIQTIGAFGRYYETMAFMAQKVGVYWEANVSEQLSFESEWSICFDKPEDIPESIDLKVDAMHDAVVQEFAERTEW